MRANLAAFGLLILVLALPTHAEPTSVVRLRDGAVQGEVEDGISIYKGLAFAAPPVGDLRWRPPEPEQPWHGILQANNFKAACMQQGPTLPGMMENYSEDCLYLNVWAPPFSGKRAVMVFLYGGGSISGSGSARLYWGDQLAKKGVVVVTFNYRLGAVGFLAHPELTREAGTSGNYGLRDIVAALRWVKTNIAAFGGDPTNVTVFGQSAGAYWESLLMVTPEAQGLFRRVIAASGGEFGTSSRGDTFSDLADSEQKGREYAEKLGARTLSDMRAVPATTIVGLDTALREGSVSAINATIDGKLVPGPVRALFAEGRQSHVDLLVGSNAGEDVEVAWRAYSWANFQAKAGVAQVYLYRFSTIPPFAPWPKLHTAGHGAELPYWFGYPSVKLLAQYEAANKAALHARIEDTIQTYWTNFAKTGNPNGHGLPSWPAFTPMEQNQLEMDDQFSIKSVAGDPAFVRLDDLHKLRP